MSLPISTKVDVSALPRGRDRAHVTRSRRPRATDIRTDHQELYVEGSTTSAHVGRETACVRHAFDIRGQAGRRHDFCNGLSQPADGTPPFNAAATDLVGDEPRELGTHHNGKACLAAETALALRPEAICSRER